MAFDIDAIFSMAIAMTHAAVPYAKPGSMFRALAWRVNSAVWACVAVGRDVVVVSERQAGFVRTQRDKKVIDHPHVDCPLDEMCSCVKRGAQPQKERDSERLVALEVAQELR